MKKKVGNTDGVLVFVIAMEFLVATILFFYYLRRVIG